MTVEIDISDIPIGTSFTDERSKRVQEIIRKEADYADFIVKRYREQEDPSQDIYIMMDATENYWVWMYGWEIDALDDAEIFSYFTVTKETSQRTDPNVNWMIAASFLFALSLALIITVIFSPELLEYNWFIWLIILPMAFSFVTGWIYTKKNRVHQQSEKEFEVSIHSKHPLFAQALHKFSKLPDISDEQRTIYQERIHELEKKMAD